MAAPGRFVSVFDESDASSAFASTWESFSRGPDSAFASASPGLPHPPTTPFTATRQPIRLPSRTSLLTQCFQALSDVETTGREGGALISAEHCSIDAQFQRLRRGEQTPSDAESPAPALTPVPHPTPAPAEDIKKGKVPERQVRSQLPPVTKPAQTAADTAAADENKTDWVCCACVAVNSHVESDCSGCRVHHRCGGCRDNVFGEAVLGAEIRGRKLKMVRKGPVGSYIFDWVWG